MLHLSPDMFSLIRRGNCGRYGWHETDRCPESHTFELNAYRVVEAQSPHAPVRR
jgi:hypothetical protein